MVEAHKCSGSIRDPRPSSLSGREVAHSTSKTQEGPLTCNWLAPTPAGSNSSNTKEETSSMSRTTRFLMSQEQEMPKVKTFKFITDIIVPTSDGTSSISTRRRKILPEESTDGSDSITTDHSTLCLDCQ